MYIFNYTYVFLYRFYPLISWQEPNREILPWLLQEARAVGDKGSLQTVHCKQKEEIRGTKIEK